MGKGCRIWLWILFLLHNATLLTAVLGLLVDSNAIQRLAAQGVSLPMTVVNIAINLVMVVSIGLLLFRRRMLGFYGILAVAVVTTVIDIWTASVSGTTGLLGAVIANFISPAITGFFVFRSREAFR